MAKLIMVATITERNLKKQIIRDVENKIIQLERNVCYFPTVDMAIEHLKKMKR